MSEAIAARLDVLERNNTELWNKHDQCDEDRKVQAVKLERLQGKADLLGNKIDNIESSTTKIETAVTSMAIKIEQLSINDAKTSGIAIGAKELIFGVVAIIGAFTALAAYFS